MTKRRVTFALLACLLVALTVLMALPMAASAASGVTSVQWSGAAYMGADAYYGGGDIAAFTAGSTATLTAQVKNEEGADITIKEAKVKFDWGGVFDATATSPTEIKNNETGIFTFEFTVPANDVATNATKHSYQVVIGFQKQGTNYVRNFAAWDDGAFTGGTTYALDHQNIIPNTIRVYFVDAAAHTITEQLTGWVADERLGTVTFTAAVPVGATVRADYRYGEAPVSGTVDGSNTVFYTSAYPLVDGSLKVYLRNDVTQNFDAATVSAVDLETGKFSLAAAPSTVQSVRVSYEYWSRMAASGSAVGTNFVVYSADQAGAMAAKVQLNDLNNQYPSYLIPFGTAGEKAYEEALVLRNQADAKYKTGDFAGAKADYEAAITKMQEAWAADTTINTTVENSLLGLLSGADGVVDAYAAKLNAEAKESKGQASMYKNVGVFTILLGVATLLAGLGGILWAYSRLVAARGPRQQI